MIDIFWVTDLKCQVPMMCQRDTFDLSDRLIVRSTGLREDKPSGGLTEIKPSCGLTDDKPSCGLTEDKPSCGLTEIKPSCGLTEDKPSCGLTEDKPSCGLTVEMIDYAWANRRPACVLGSPTI